jgi:flagellar biosynthetic protein FliO
VRITRGTIIPGPAAISAAAAGQHSAVLIATIVMSIFWLVLTGPLPLAGASQESQRLVESPADFPPQSPPAPLLEAELKETSSLFLAVVKALAALAVVLGLIVLMTKWLKRMGWGSDNPGTVSLIKVVETRMIAPKKYVAIVQVAREFVVVGVTEQQINLLVKLEHTDSLLEELAPRQAGPTPLNGSFAARLRKACTTT